MTRQARRYVRRDGGEAIDKSNVAKPGTCMWDYDHGLPATGDTCKAVYNIAAVIHAKPQPYPELTSNDPRR